jgi:hypothetical protein
VLPIEVSIVVQPDEAAALATSSFGNVMYGLKNLTLRHVARPYVRRRMQP